jgi:hypothetical protein
VGTPVCVSVRTENMSDLQPRPPELLGHALAEQVAFRSAQQVEGTSDAL